MPSLKVLAEYDRHPCFTLLKLSLPKNMRFKSLVLVDTIDKHFPVCYIFSFPLQRVNLPYYLFSDEKYVSTMEEIQTVLTWAGELTYSLHK